MLKFTVAFLTLIFVPHALAGETDWVDVAPDARLRLIASGVLTDDKTFVALEIDMPEHMKTYWRIPGETGIPTQVDIAESEHVAAHQILWPYPLREKKDGYVDFVYYGPTVLPIELMLGEGARQIEADVVMGICDEICVPVRTSFKLDLDFSRPDKGHGLRIRQALAEVPIAWSEAEEPVGEVWFDAEEGRVNVALNTSAVDPATLIVDNGNPSILFSMPQKSREGGVISFELLARGAKDGLHDRPVRLTFQSVNGAFELSRIVQLARSETEGN